MAESVIYIREHGIKSVKQLDEYIQKAADERQNIQEKIKAIDKEMQMLSTTMEKVHTVKKYRTCYKEYKANPSDKAFFEEYKAQITLYENALSELKKSYSKLPNSKDILAELDKLQEKRIPLYKSILLPNLLWMSFIKYERTMEFIWIRRWRDRLTSSLSTIFLMIYILNIISRKPSTFNLCIFKYHWILSQNNKSNSYFPIYFINFFKIILKPF